MTGEGYKVVRFEDDITILLPMASAVQNLTVVMLLVKYLPGSDEGLTYQHMSVATYYTALQKSSSLPLYDQQYKRQLDNGVIP